MIFHSSVGIPKRNPITILENIYKHQTSPGGRRQPSRFLPVGRRTFQRQPGLLEDGHGPRELQRHGRGDGPQRQAMAIFNQENSWGVHHVMVM